MEIELGHCFLKWIYILKASTALVRHPLSRAPAKSMS